MQPHIRLNTSLTRARYALLPGDPGRVDRIARFLDNAEVIGQNREFRAARGWYQGVEIVVLSRELADHQLPSLLRSCARLASTR
ncbi:uridine phosphorylase [Salmonella enterica subsp. arizonae]|nr:uridine phosphorylase [Salmonella enterica subsp. arizonae]